MLSTIDRIIFLKEVPFFQTLGILQLKELAPACEENFFLKDSYIFHKGDAGGTLYMVVNGRVGIEYEKRAGSFARLDDKNSYAFFGEANFFDASQHTTDALAIHDTSILQLHREPLIGLVRQKPSLALELINTLSRSLREDDQRAAKLKSVQPGNLSKLFDKLS